MNQRLNTVRRAFTSLPLAAADSVTVVLRLTLPDVMVKVADFAPAGTTTLSGTEATLGDELSNCTVAPEVVDSVTVATIVLRLGMLDDGRLMALGTPGFTDGVGAGSLTVMAIGDDVAVAP